MFRITDYIEFDSNGRAICPNCALAKKTSKNLSLVPNTDGAYKCFRGCTPSAIREALGAKKDTTIIPTVEAQPVPSVTVPPIKVHQAHKRLVEKSTHALSWLNDRGITREMIDHYKLGVVRSRVGDSTKPSGFVHLPSISIPIPANTHGTSYYQKKRVQPWGENHPDGYRPWSQYGIPQTVFTTHQPESAIATWLCEGEWDAMVLAWAVRHSELKNNVQVSCFTCGAGNVPPDSELAKLTGDVYIWYDLDEPGRSGAEKLQQRLKSRSIICTVPSQPESAEGWDVSDAIAAGLFSEFVAAAADGRHWEKPKTENPLRERIVSNDEMLARAPDFTDWLVDDILTADELFLLAASPRAGKSLLALTLAQAVASGGKFLGRPVSQGGVIYIRCEDSETKTKERELRQGWEEGLPVYWLDKFKLTELEQLEELVEELDISLVVFDTLSRVRDATVSESSAEMSQLLEPLQEMCKRQRCTGLLVHHTGKVSTDNAGTINVFDTVRGSSAIRATCRGSLILAADERNYRLYVENGWGKMDLQVLLDAHTLQWKLVGNWIGPDVDVSQKDRVLNYLKQVGNATIEDIAEGTNLPKRSLYEVLKRLQSDGEIEKHGSRRSSRYVTSSIQQIQQLNTLLNSQDTERERISPSIQQLPESASPPEKVIILDESDQNRDHFCDHPLPPTPGDLLNKTPESIHSNGLRIQQQFNTIQQPIQQGDQIRIKTGRFEGLKATVINASKDSVEVQAKTWLVTRFYSLLDGSVELERGDIDE